MNLNPIAGIIEAVGGVIGDLTTSDKERLDAQIELAKLGIESEKIEAGITEAQISVNLQEAKHESIFVAGWRPAIGWVGAAAMAYQFIAYPLMVWGWASMQASGWLDPKLTPPPMLDTDALWVILSGILGIAGMRSVEKVKGRSK